MTERSFRTDVLHHFGARSETLGELLNYNENTFDHSAPAIAPLDEPFVDAWRGYTQKALARGAFEALQECLVQFHFPIRKDVSKTPAYRQATRRGILPPLASERLLLERPECLRLFVHRTPAGHLPVLFTSYRPDFVTLVRALLRKNEPATIPDSMGGAMVAGYNNWDRIRAYKKAWERRTTAPTKAAWHREFQWLIPNRALYQDRFILMSDGPYSAIPAATLGLNESMWRRHSLVIRREHEGAHYYTRRVLGSMRSNALDELIADFVGITAAVGNYRVDWFLHFMGLESFPAYRTGGRLENYRGDLSDAAFRVLRGLVFSAACRLEQHGSFLTEEADTQKRTALILQTLTRLTLEELASDRAEGLLREAYGLACRAVAAASRWTNGPVSNGAGVRGPAVAVHGAEIEATH